MLPAGELSALGCALLWAFSTIALRSQSTRVPVLALNAIRTAYSAIVVLAALAVMGRLGDLFLVPTAALFGLLASVVMGIAPGDSLHFRAMHAIGVSRALPISSSYPILTAVLATLWLDEPLTPRIGLGILLVVGGVYLVAFPRHRGRLEDVPAAPVRSGVTMALGASFCWAISTALVKPSLDQIDPVLGNGIRMPFAFLFIGGLSLLGGQPANPFGFGRRAGTVLALAGVMSGASGALWLYAVHAAGAAKAATLSSTAPIFAAPLAVLLLGERLTGQVAVGTVLSIVGIWLVL